MRSSSSCSMVSEMAGTKCGCEKATVLIYPCSGASDLGQACNELALSVAEQGRARMSCLAGVGGHVPNLTMSAQSADVVIALDGCQVACARKVLQHAGVEPSVHIIATDLGLNKAVGRRFTREQLEIISSALDLSLNERNAP